MDNVCLSFFDALTHFKVDLIHTDSIQDSS